MRYPPLVVEVRAAWQNSPSIAPAAVRGAGRMVQI